MDEKVIQRKIKAEIKRIKPLFLDLDEARASFVEKQLGKLAFLQVTLARLETIINTTEVVENFKQGKQSFQRENPALKSYNATFKSYCLISKQLCDLLPGGKGEETESELLNFVCNTK
jgi:hypothetical protein